VQPALVSCLLSEWESGFQIFSRFAIVLLGTSQVRSPGGDLSYYYYRCSAAVGSVASAWPHVLPHARILIDPNLNTLLPVEHPARPELSSLLLALLVDWALIGYRLLAI
jgi:hypothetical protein